MAEAVVLVVDTGATSAMGNPSFLTRALACASGFVERKLYSESKDVLGLVLFGCEATENPLEYEGVRVVGRGLATADWDTVTFLREQVDGSAAQGDWIDALVVALDFLKGQTEGKKFTALKIVLFSELGGRADNDEDQVELIIQGMKTLDNIDFTHIGPDWGEAEVRVKEEGVRVKEEEGPDSQGGAGPGAGRQEGGKPRTEVQRENEALVGRLVAETDGLVCSLEDALAAFLFRNKKGKTSMPWKAVLEVGPEVRVPVTGFVRVRREAPRSWRRCLARQVPGEEEMELKADTTFVRNTEEQEEVELDNLVQAYRYGPEMVVISREDEEAARYKGEEGKALQLFGFLSREELRPSDLVGDGAMVFLPQDGDSNSEAAVAALARAMLELGVVAVVRKVYRKGTSARLGVLCPEQEEGEEGEGGTVLSYIELPFAEEVRELQFPPLPAAREEQLSAMDDLIDVMMLTQVTRGLWWRWWLCGGGGGCVVEVVPVVAVWWLWWLLEMVVVV